MFALQSEKVREAHTKAKKFLADGITDGKLSGEEVDDLRDTLLQMEDIFRISSLCAFNEDLAIRTGESLIRCMSAMSMADTSDQIKITRDLVEDWARANPHHREVPPELWLET